MKKIFQRSGYLDNNLNSYEYRDSQLEMAQFILNRLDDTENGIIEAGTGTGKSMAYLFPAILYSLSKGKRVAISTETKALQQQLLDKDLPIVQKICEEDMELDFKYSICLGSSNYPCRRRFERTVKKGKFSQSDMLYVKKMSDMFTEMPIFTFFDMNCPSTFWEEVNRDPDACNHQRCPYSRQCPFQSAKKEWAQSDILIMNHYLFFSNIASGKAYLPVTEAVLFDEAHSIETIASNQLGFNIDFPLLAKILARFYVKGRHGVVYSFKDTIIQQECINLIDKIIKEGQKFFEQLRDLFPEKNNVLRITRELKMGMKLTSHLTQFVEMIVKAEDDFDEDDMTMEFEPAKNKLMAFSEALNFFLDMKKDSYVYWIERSSQELLGNIKVVARPVNINEIMQSDVYSFYESTLFISATLSVKNDFSYFINRIGFMGGRSINLKSPFDYKKQMLLYTDRNIPEPNNMAFPEKISAIIEEIVNIVDGNCLVLFTSYSMLRTVKHVLQRNIKNRIFSQDELSASGAIAAYLANKGSVLLGTHSFWQGIDLPGDLLKSVIITRLPFSVPNTPIMKARIEKIEQQGMNSFFDLQIPEAVIKMKQGAGRLIRSETDKGIVAVLDPRIISKGYGASFMDSLPDGERITDLASLSTKYRELLGIYEN